MTATITQCADALKALLEPLLVGSGLPANAVDEYRTFPNKLSRHVIITYSGGLPNRLSTQGTVQPYRDFTIVLAAQHDNTEATLETAEEALNTMETIIEAALIASINATYWHRVFFERPSDRPPSPREAPNLRWGFMYPRLLIK